jgi:SOS-response transcriptional repressor LexA
VLHEFYPSSLLWSDNLSEAGRDLTVRCRDMQGVDPDAVRQMMADAEELAGAGHANDAATVLICLADRCREGGEPDLARECCKKAEPLVCVYEDPRYRHNLAVAFYALGLACQAQGLDREAVANYDKAVRLFECACREWIDVRDCAQGRMRQCSSVVRWIRSLRMDLVPGDAARQPPSSTVIRFPVLSATSAGDPLCAMEEFDEWVEVEESTAGRATYALRVEGDSMTGAGIYQGDIVLIQGTNAWPSDGQIVVVRIDGMESGSVLKRFYRHSDHICLEPANAAYPFLIIQHGRRFEGEIRKRYEQRYPGPPPQFYQESLAHCVGWYERKVGLDKEALFQRGTAG